MEFKCPNCNKLGSIDEVNVPESGVYATCSECNCMFLVKREALKDFSFESVELADELENYKVAIGKNFDKYIAVIELVRRDNSTPVSWHWPAFFVGILWAFYRKMYKIGFIYWGIIIFLSIVAGFSFSKVALVITTLLAFGVQVVFAMYAKTIYAKRIISKISGYSHFTQSQLKNKLVLEGNTNSWMPYFALIFIAGIIVAISIPQFVAYKKRITVAPPPSFSENHATSPLPPASAGLYDDLVSDLKPHQQVQTPAIATSGEFIFTDMTALDSKTGLMWARDGNIASDMNWTDAVIWVKNLNYGGYSDWRLPNKEEIGAFMSRCGYRPSEAYNANVRDGNRPYEWFNANGFIKVQAGDYWSSSSDARFTSMASVVSMNGGNFWRSDKTDKKYTLPVRDVR